MGRNGMNRRDFLRSLGFAAGGLALGIGQGELKAMSDETEVIACPIAGGLPGASDVSLTVNGVPVGVELYIPPPPRENAPSWFLNEPWAKDLRIYIARFACSGPCELWLRAQGRTAAPLVRPKSRAVTVKAEGDVATLALPGPGKYYVEQTPGPPLLVIADPADAPWHHVSGAPSRYLGPGVHQPGLMRLEDGEIVHIAAGALVYGGFQGGAHGARIVGTGVLDGSKLPRRMVSFREASDIEVAGIIIRGGNGWQNTLSGCRNMTYRGVSAISAVPTGDGVDPVDCNGVRVEDCFFRCTDDCVAVKARSGGAVGNISVKGCVMVGQAFSDGFTCGFEMVADSVTGIRVEDCDVLYARGGNMVGRHSAFSVICDGPATVSDAVFENIRVEENVERLFELHITDGQSYVHQPPGRIQQVVVRNVAWEIEAPIILHGFDAQHMVKDVLFQGCTVAGRPLSEVKDRIVQQNEFVSGVRYA